MAEKNEAVEMTGTILKITRKNGALRAELSMTFPAVKAGDVPLGEVSMTIVKAQRSLFPVEKEKGVKSKRSTAVRGVTVIDSKSVRGVTTTR